MSEVFNYCHVVGRTDVGRKRTANEDNMCNAITQNGLVSVVCDGMGGHVGGATASKIAVRSIVENLNAVYYEDPRIAIGESIDVANRAIIQETIEHPELSGMGSTCVLLLVRGGKVYIGHVGDSRIYLVRSKRIAQLTKDHSYVQMLVDCGEITREQAEHHPRKNEITNALGIQNMTPATVADDAIIPEAGDCFVLCSDGLSGMVSDGTICKVVSKQTEMNAQERVDRLVAIANENGGVDNISVQLVEFSVSPAAVSSKKKIPLWVKIGCPVLLCLLLGAGAYLLLKNKGGNGKDYPSEAVAEKVDTLEIKLNDVPFEKKGRLLELSYEENALLLMRGDEIIFREINTSFEQSSLMVDSSDIKVEFQNSLLSFTEKYPGRQVSFTLATADSLRIYRFIIGIKEEGMRKDIKDGKLSVPPGDASGSTTPKKERDDRSVQKKEEKRDTVYIDFAYDALGIESRLLFNYFAKPVIIFNSQEKSIGVRYKNIIETELSFDDLRWEKEYKENKSQLIFKFKGDSSKEIHRFEIPCSSADSDTIVIVSVKLYPALPIDETDIEEGEALRYA